MKKENAATPRTVLLAFAMALAASAAAADDASPVFRPSLEIKRATGEIRLDGRLDDPGWRDAARTDRFVERSPGENVPPAVQTEARLAYDDDYLYVGFDCQDDPESLRATMCQRDQYDSDDAVVLLLDTFGEASWAYEFMVNPYGIQRDQIWTSVHGEDSGFDVVWDDAARVTEGGYTVEMAIPMSALRFPDAEEQTWRVDLWRNRPRETVHQYSWAAYDRNEQCFPCQWGTVTGIAGVRPGKGLEVLPSFIGYQTGELADDAAPERGFDNRDLQGEVSLGAKYAVTSGVTVEGTYNPDFSQIEADADLIDVNSTIVQRYPERRPFFQEGNDLFRTMFNSFYTRMVNAPELAAKATARGERSSVAYLLARDELSPYIIPAEERSYTAAPGRSTVNVLRGLQSFGSGTQVGFMATDRRYDRGGSGTILSSDFSLRLSSRDSWTGQFIESYTTEPTGLAISSDATFDDGRHTIDLDGERYHGAAFITELRHRSRGWNVTLDYNQLAPTYRTQTGYDPWTDQRNGFIYVNRNFWPQGGPCERIIPGLFLDGRWNMAGKRKWRHASAQVDFRFRWAQTHVGLNGSMGQEVWGGVPFDNLWSFTGGVDGRPSDALGYSISARVGRGPALSTLGLGDETGVSLALALKPIDRLTIEPTLDYVRSEDAATGALLFRQTITRARLQVQTSSRLSLRLVLQHNDSLNPALREAALQGERPLYYLYYGSKWEIDPLLTYRVNPLSVFYLGSTHDYHDIGAADPARPADFTMTSRQFFTKLQYLFQL